MPYIIPSVAAFKARFPEFVDVTDPVISTFLTAAADEGVDAALWMERDYQIAVMLLAAHYLSLYQQQLLANALPTGGGGGGGSGSDLITYMSSIRWDDKAISFGAKSASNTSQSGGSGAGGPGYATILDETPYGSQFAKIRRRNIFTIMAT